MDNSYSEMTSLDYWRLSDHLSVVQAALLLVGEDPSHIAEYVEGWDVDKRPIGYEAAKNFVRNGLRFGSLEGEAKPERHYDINGNIEWEDPDSIDLNESWVSVASLRRCLGDRGMSTGFFFPKGAAAPDYLDPLHERYAPKLAAAVRAWEAVGNASDLGGRSPKQALAKWLRENAADFSLSDDEGKPNETGIEEVAKVANWRPSGGAPKTPSAASEGTK